MESTPKRTYPRVTKLLEGAVAEKGQRTVAREAGIPLLSVQRYLKGIGEPTTATLEKLAKYFGVSVAWLRGEAAPRGLKDLIRMGDGLADAGLTVEYGDGVKLDKGALAVIGMAFVEMVRAFSGSEEDMAEVKSAILTLKKEWSEIASTSEPPPET